MSSTTSTMFWPARSLARLRHLVRIGWYMPVFGTSASNILHLCEIYPFGMETARQHLMAFMILCGRDKLDRVRTKVVLGGARHLTHLMLLVALVVQLQKESTLEQAEYRMRGVNAAKVSRGSLLEVRGLPEGTRWCSTLHVRSCKFASLRCLGPIVP
jgi:hypothetical protein